MKQVKDGSTRVPGTFAGMAGRLGSDGTWAMAPPCGFSSMVTSRESDFSVMGSPRVSDPDRAGQSSTAFLARP